MDVENGTMHEMNVGSKKETWEWSSVLQVLHADMCPFAIGVTVKEEITSSRKMV